MSLWEFRSGEVWLWVVWTRALLQVPPSIVTSNPQHCFWTPTSPLITHWQRTAQREAPSASSSAFGLTSEVEEAQVMGDNLLSSFPCTEFDSAGEEDVSPPPCGEWMALPRCLYVRYMYDSWKRRGLRTARQSQVPHRGTFQCCI